MKPSKNLYNIQVGLLHDVQKHILSITIQNSNLKCPFVNQNNSNYT